jgi:(p)ppGpp synthase/HD superfamily hydrolase
MKVLLGKAQFLATKVHAGQYRKDSGLPYIFHPQEGTLLMQRDGCECEVTLASMMLHDACESDAKQRITVQNIAIATGSQAVANCVEFLTCDADRDKNDYIASFRYAPLNALVVKLYDRYINVEDFNRTQEINNSYYTKYAAKGLPVIDTVLEKDKLAEIEGYYGEGFANNIMRRASYLKDIAGLHIG